MPVIQTLRSGADRVRTRYGTARSSIRKWAVENEVKGRSIRVARHFGFVRYLLILGGVVAGAYYVCGRLTPDAEDQLRYAGVMLQMAGLVAVVYGIASNRRLVGRAGVKDSMLRWFKRLRGASRKSDVLTVNPLVIKPVAHSLKLESRPSAESIGERVNQLERQLAELRNSMNRSDRTLREQLSEAKEDASRRARALSQQLSSVGEQVENLAAGGSVTELIGVVWVAIGILLSSLPEELAALW